MGLFSTKKATLSKELFSLDGRIKSSAQDIILSKLSDIIPTQLFYRIWLTGSMIGLRYEDDSDIDVQVQINDASKVDYYSTEAKVFNRSGLNVLIGKHPVSYFVLPKIETNDYSNLTGAFDLANNKWIKHAIDNPPGLEKEIEQSSAYLGLLTREVGRQIEQMKANPTIDEAEDVSDLYRQLDQDRKATYESGVGIPRFSPANIAYKTVEKEYGEVPERIHHLVRKILSGN